MPRGGQLVQVPAYCSESTTRNARWRAENLRVAALARLIEATGGRSGVRAEYDDEVGVGIGDLADAARS